MLRNAFESRALFRFFYGFIFLFIFAFLAQTTFAVEMDLRNGSYYGERQKVRAPELKGAKGWLNSDKPLSIAALKGKIILLDFWTYGCINCIHIIPDLKKLEAKYGDRLVVIGVHSAKFENEGETENIRRIILRYGIEHPVANDADYKIWDAYAVRAYPTQVVIDPAGYIAGRFVGEGYFDEIDRAIGETSEEFSKKGLLDETPVKFALERAKIGALPLAFPGKILADEAGNRLFIADSNHNRIVVTDLQGNLSDVIGSGEAGLKDGGFENSSFRKPQGMALNGEHLFVADTENHSIRRVDLKNKSVETVGGTGDLRNFDGTGGKPLETALRSPWDLSLVGKFLYIAMAGSHQIWRLDLEKNHLEPYAGTRLEARIDGKIKKSAFSQPSGIVSDGANLFVADSEANIIRRIDLIKEHVETLAGGDLWVFGDRDGSGDDVRLQHPLGIELYKGKILIADTYNHKIKLLDPFKRSVKTFLGTGARGQIDGRRATLYEPGGISLAGERLFIADTNNHAVRVADLNTREISTLKIEGLKPPVEIETGSVSPNKLEIDLSEQKISANSKNSIVFDIKLPKDFHLNPDAPQRYEISFENGENPPVQGATNFSIENARSRFTKLPLEVFFQTGAPAPAASAAAKIRAKLTIFYCREDNTGVCLIKSVIWNVPVKITSDEKAASRIKLSAAVEVQEK